CQALDDAGFVTPATRIVVEKPLGESRASFEEIDSHIKSVFDEQQIYRIDHYLGKETAQNLLALRFANVFFEPLWNRHYIDHVQITAAESIGVGGRWSFYDEAGALRDMVQNHLLQLLCLVSMEPPAKNRPDFVRDEKLKVLRCLKPVQAHDVGDVTVRGQYAQGRVEDESVPGYAQEQDAKSTRSNTETFVAIKAEIENTRWQGVPFYLRTGKRLAQRRLEIIIQFKPVVHKFFDSVGGNLSANQLVIRLQPNEGVELEIVNKVPGLTEQTRLQGVDLDLSFAEVFDAHRAPSAYERLLLDVMRADQTLFMRSDELCAAWDWVDGILQGWQTNGQPVANYASGSWGPSESVDLLARDRRRWFDHQ
ncbi:MAG: glucose-6-phosphate dehydrogenase, partial [Pseudomonadales bacterium]